MHVVWGNVELDTDDDAVLSTHEIQMLYRGKCVVCRRVTLTVHEIVPKSRMTRWQVWHNRVTLCPTCHEEVHSRGAIHAEPYLLQCRDRRLLDYYGSYGSDEFNNS